MTPWQTVLARLASQRPALAATLAGSTALREEDRILHVEVPRFGAFQKGTLEKAVNKQLVMELVAEVYGYPLGVRFVSAVPPPAPAVDPVQALADALAKRLERDPSIMYCFIEGIRVELVLAQTIGDSARVDDLLGVYEAASRARAALVVTAR